jgi:hypothetical protein
MHSASPQTALGHGRALIEVRLRLIQWLLSTIRGKRTEDYRRGGPESAPWPAFRCDGWSQATALNVVIRFASSGSKRWAGTVGSPRVAKNSQSASGRPHKGPPIPIHGMAVVQTRSRTHVWLTGLTNRSVK